MGILSRFTAKLCEVGKPDDFQECLNTASTRRAWWDQRGVIDANDPEQPQALDMTDVER